MNDIVFKDKNYLICKQDLAWIRRDHFIQPFRQGYQDKIHNLGYRDEYEFMTDMGQYNYELGRLFAIFYQGDLNTDEAAIAYYKYYFDKKNS